MTLSDRHVQASSSRVFYNLARVGLGLLLVASVVARVIAPEQTAASSAFPPAALGFLESLRAAPYFNPLLFGTELLVGLALIANRFVPLALLVFAPVNLNIALFHLFLDPRPLRLGLIALLLGSHVYLAWAHRHRFADLFQSPKLSRIARAVTALLGLVFVVAGAGKLFVPFENLRYGAGTAFMTALRDSGYLFTLLALTELLAGAMLLAGRWVPLALTLLAPVVVHIALFHLFVNPAPQGLVVSALLTLAGLALAFWTRTSHQRWLEP